MPTYISRLLRRGRKVYSHLTADTEKELFHFARRLREPVHGHDGKGRLLHLDLNEHKRSLALRYGAREKDDE